MLLGNSDIKEAVMVRFGKLIKSRPRRHCSGYGNYILVFLCKLDKLMAEYIGKAFSTFLKCAGLRVELAYTMVLVRVLLGILTPLAFLGQNMDKNSRFHFLCPANYGLKLLNIVPVNRTEVINTHRIEQI